MPALASRASKQDAQYTFRVNATLLDRVETAAERDGASTPEFIRSVLRRAVERVK